MRGHRLTHGPAKAIRDWAIGIGTVCALSASSLPAEDLSYRFQSPFIEDEASVVPIENIAQDSQGYIWLAQRRTLRRFDGINLASVEKPRHHLLSSIAAGPDGTVWLGTLHNGILRWTSEQQAAAPVDLSAAGIGAKSRIEALGIDGEGFLWISTSDGTIVRYDTATGAAAPFTPSALESGRVEPILVTEIVATSSGRVWLLSDEQRLYRVDLDNGSVTAAPFERSTGRVTALTAGPDETLWIGTATGDLVRVHESSLDNTLVVDGDRQHEAVETGGITALTADPQGHLWVGTQLGLKVLAPQSDRLQDVFSNPESPTEPSTDPVHCLFLDRSAVLWAASGTGELATTSTRASAFAHWRIDADGASAPILSLAEGSDGSLWAGTYRSGLFRKYPSGALRHYGRRTEGADETNPVALLFDRRNQLWIGTLNRGLSLMDPVTEEFTHYREDSSGLSNDTITALAEAGDGRILIGTFTGGLNVLDPSTETFEVHTHDEGDPSSISENQVRSILEDSQGRLWLGTRNHGLNLRMPGQTGFVRLRSDPGDPTTLADDTVVSLAEDRDGRVWIGTYQGLHRVAMQGGRATFERFGPEEGLLGLKVFSIQQDSDGYLWLSTSRGISRLDPATGTFVNLSRNHGLPPGGFNFGAAHTTRRGRLLLGSKYGVTSFHPSDVSLQPYVPPIVLTSVAKMGQAAQPPIGRELVLRHDETVISFDFSLLDFIAPRRNRYEHLLEGFDEGWIDLGNHQRATYSNLPPGQYIFRARGANGEGVWSAADATLAIRVLPPPWATWWAYSLYALLACGAVFGYVRHQARKQRHEALYTQRLEREVHRRTRELAEQNEKLRYANELLEVASVTDSLTGVRNRRFLLTTIDQDIALVDRAFAAMSDEARQDSAFVFILFDLDGFKEINDSHGHSAGDLVLFQVRDLLNQACRASDTLIRWGGDEFLIVAREATRAHVEALAERIRQSVADHLFDIGTACPVQLTCSLGFACYPFVASSPRLYSWEEVIDIADRALYVAKRHGPNMWAGIFGTEHTVETPAEDLLVMIMERPELLGAEGSIRLVTSRPTPTQTELHPATSGNQRAS